MLSIKRGKEIRSFSIVYFTTLSITFNALPHLCFADSQAIINKLGSCFGACSSGTAGGEDCRNKCWKGYQIDLHPEILQEEQNRKKQEEELKRKKHEEELKQKQSKEELNEENPQEQPQENLNPGDRLKRVPPDKS